MTPVDGIPAGRATVDPKVAAQLAKLAKTAKQFEAVFVQQMFAAMRETVPKDGVVSGGAGEELFSSMFDQKLADSTPQHWQHGLSEAIVAHLRSRIVPPDAQAVHASHTTSRPITPEGP